MQDVDNNAEILHGQETCTDLCFFLIFSFSGLSGLSMFFFIFLLLNLVNDFVPGPARASTTWGNKTQSSHIQRYDIGWSSWHIHKTKVIDSQYCRLLNNKACLNCCSFACSDAPTLRSPTYTFNPLFLTNTQRNSSIVVSSISTFGWQHWIAYITDTP